ncbi:MAG: hypothetical protein QOH61_1432 [Chloroflexota bacterium]|jgi:NitT/TauT family transport system permease protein|nr:hypothetical protein [Chloroflexota bacterium]
MTVAPLPANVPRTSGRTAPRLTPRQERLLLRTIGVVGFLVVWELAARLHLYNAILLSSPSAVIGAGFGIMTSGTVWRHLWASAVELAAGLVISTVVGVAIGVAAGWSRRVNYVLDPWLTILNATPIVALVPLLIFLLGIDFAAKVFLIVLFSVFPIALNTLVGVEGTANRYLGVARTYRASNARILRTVVMPGTLPFILAGLHIAVGRALVGLVVAELVAGNEGIGYLLSLYGVTLQTPKLMFLVFVLGLTGLALSAAVGRVERRLERWRPVRR